MRLQLVVLVAVVAESASAFTSPVWSGTSSNVARRRALQLRSTSMSDDFANFAASLDESVPTKKSKNSSSSATSSQRQDQQQRERTTRSSATSVASKNNSWQESLEELLDPLTPLARRQILLSDLMSSQGDIRASVETALRDRKIDPLLTPTGKKLQDGTRAVARQLVSDILPSLAARPPRLLPPPPQEIQKVGNRLFNALQNQLQSTFEQLQQDLQDPTTRIPARLSQQTEDIVKEAANVFAETPVGLKGPPYTVVYTSPEYEIRDYEGYTVASTNMLGWEDETEAASTEDNTNFAKQGAAFNSLATYLFGANREGQVMEMTTPVTTTITGEMRFYLATNPNSPPPEPLEQDESKSMFETGTGRIRIQPIPPARLAVRRFTGFVTQGEIARQKEALLTALQMDADANFELDVDHGQTVGHLIFQYNPPYTLPVIRRNEIAVPIRRTDDSAAQDGNVDIADEWK